MMINKSMIAVGMLTASLLYAGEAHAALVTYNFNFTTGGVSGDINPSPETSGPKDYMSEEDLTLLLKVSPIVNSLAPIDRLLSNNLSGLGMYVRGDTSLLNVLNFNDPNNEREFLKLDLAALNSLVFSTYGSNITSYSLVVSSSVPGTQGGYKLGATPEAILNMGTLNFSGNFDLFLYSPADSDAGSYRLVSLAFTFDDNPSTPTPEPGIVALLGFSLAGLAFLRYRK